MKKIRKNYSHKQILEYWLHDLMKLKKGDSFQDLEGCCFACGWESELERAHIQPLSLSGLDEIANIHLLCSECHWASEDLSGKNYWAWLQRRNQLSWIYQVASYRQ